MRGRPFATIGLILNLGLTGCLNGPGFLSQERNAEKTDKATSPQAVAPVVTDPAASATGQAVVLKDDGEAVITKLSAGGTSAQLVTASAGSAVAKSKVSFPPGSLAVDTEVSVEEGAAIVGSTFADELGLEADNGFSTAGASVIVSSTTPIDAAVPFTVSVALDQSLGLGGLGLVELDRSRVVIAFRVFIAKDNEWNVGVIPTSELTFEADGNVSFGIQYFGVYQPALLDRPIERRIIAKTEEQTAAVRQSQVRAEPTLTWSTPSIGFDAATRTAKCSASASAPVRGCSIVFDRDRLGADIRMRTREASSGSIVVEAEKEAAAVYCRIDCLDALGRITASDWSTESVAFPRGAGSGTGTGTGTGSATVVVDRGPILKGPELPASGFLDPRLRTITLVFDRRIEATSVITGVGGVTAAGGGASIKLYEKPAGEPIPLSVQVIDTRIKLSFARELRTGASFEIVVSGGLRGSSGLATNEPQFTGFQTIKGDWISTPSVLTDESVPEHGGPFATNARGEAVMLKSSPGGITAMRYSPGSAGWETIGLVTTDEASLLPSDAAVAMGANGDIVVVWIRNVGGLDNLFFRRWLFNAVTNTGTWQTEGVLVPSIPNKPKIRSLTINGAGTAVVLFNRLVSAPYGLFSATVARAAVVGGAVVQAPGVTTYNVDKVRIATNEHGDILVSYKAVAGDFRAHYASYNAANGVQWMPASQPLGTATVDVDAVEVALDDIGNGIAAWTAFDASTWTVEARRVKVVVGSAPVFDGTNAQIAQGVGTLLLGIGKVGPGAFDLVVKQGMVAPAFGVFVRRLDAFGLAPALLPWFQGTKPAKFFSSKERYFMATNDGAGHIGIAFNDAAHTLKGPVDVFFDAGYGLNSVVDMQVFDGGGLLTVIRDDATSRDGGAVRFGPDGVGGLMPLASTLIGPFQTIPRLAGVVAPNGLGALFIDEDTNITSRIFAIP